MYAQLFGLLLFACQIIFNESTVIREHSDPVSLGRRPSLASRHGTLPNGYVKFPDVHAAYKVHEENTTWHEARIRCLGEGAYLAIADSVDKIVHINSLKTAAFKWLHVGFYYSMDNNAWIRVDNGLSVTSIPWLRDDPVQASLGDCAGISIFADALVRYKCHWGGEWFACEIPI